MQVNSLNPLQNCLLVDADAGAVATRLNTFMQASVTALLVAMTTQNTFSLSAILAQHANELVTVYRVFRFVLAELPGGVRLRGPSAEDLNDIPT
jgi:hypothetical protein